MFIKNADPFANVSQDPIDLLESITAPELASCVPIIKITKIDKFGKPAADVRPLMYDLVQTPQFGPNADDFGLDSDIFVERALVSLNSLTVKYDLNYGLSMFRDVEIEFTVHHPAIVFDRTSKIAWREIMEEGKSFSLEYGWVADPTIVKNELFNGNGIVSDKGLIIKSTQSVLLNIYSYSTKLAATGEVTVVVKAKENGDLALRQTKFSDDFEAAFEQNEADDIENVKRLKQLITSIDTIHGKNRDEFYKLGDILDKIIAPMIETAARNFGYSGYGNSTKASIYGAKVDIPAGPVALLLGKFNEDSCTQSKAWGGKAVAGKGIENFLIPKNILMKLLSSHFAAGRPLFLYTFILMIINLVVSDEAWAQNVQGQFSRKPEIMLKSDTLKNQDGSHRLVMVIYDRKTGTDPFHQRDGNDSRNFIALEKQSKDNVLSKLKDLGVPVIEFAKAGSLILDASFDLQLDTLLQAHLVDVAYKDRKDRVEQTATPDTESRKGQSRNGELIIPVSILEGTLLMYGNFAMDVFAIMWVEFFGSSQISGVYHAIGKVDKIEPGKFTSEIKIMSEGIDPLNTRRMRTNAELAEDNARAHANLARKK